MNKTVPTMDASPPPSATLGEQIRWGMDMAEQLEAFAATYRKVAGKKLRRARADLQERYGVRSAPWRTILRHAHLSEEQADALCELAPPPGG